MTSSIKPTVPALGSWSNDNFTDTALNTPPHGVETNVPDATRFISGVVKLIRKRIQETEGSDSPRPAVLLLKPGASITWDTEPKRIPMLDNGLTQLTGRVWFVAPAVASGKFIDVGDCDDERLFEMITDELDLGDVPAIIFDPRSSQPSVRFYYSGLNDIDNYESFDIANDDVSLDDIFAVIENIYNSVLKTPDAQSKMGKLWVDSKKYWVTKQAEELIQLHLRVGLIGAFPSWTVREEQTNISGRLDLEIEVSDKTQPHRFIRHAILELKVLRSFGSTGNSVSEKETLDWIKSGVQQVANYRDERDAKAAALCCFDMRTKNDGEACFCHVTDLATHLQVVLKRWYIYATSKHYREEATTFV